MDYSKLSDDTLRALKAGKPLDYSKLSNDEVIELSKSAKSKTPQTPEPISKTESALRGAAQGASLGFADELTGGGEAVLDKILGKDGNLSDLYSKHRDESRQAYKAAEEENPLTSFAGSLVGGIASPIPLGSTKTVGQALLSGAKLGALAGLGSSEKEITNPDILKDVGMGAGVGGALGAAGKGIGKALEAAGGTDVGKAYAYGKAGERLQGKEARQRVGNEVVDFAGKTGKDIQDEMLQAAKAKAGMLDEAEATGEKMDLTDLLTNHYKEEVEKLPKSFTSEGDAARASLNQPIERAKELNPLYNKASKEPAEGIGGLMDETYGNPDVTHTEVPEDLKFEMSPKEIDSFRRALGRLGFEKDLKDDQVVALAKRLSGKVSERLNTEPEMFGSINAETGLNPLGEANKKIQSLNSAQDIFNVGKGIDELGSEKALTPLLQRLESENVSSDVARSQFEKGIGALKEANPELGSGIEKQGMALADKYAVTKGINKPFSFTGNPAEMTKRIMGPAANVLGLGVNAVKNTAPAKIASTAFNAAPEYINGLAMKLEAKQSKFAPVLRQLAGETDIKRKAMMFSLMQQPAFREAINTESDNDNK